ADFHCQRPVLIRVFIVSAACILPRVAIAFEKRTADLRSSVEKSVSAQKPTETTTRPDRSRRPTAALVRTNPTPPAPYGAHRLPLLLSLEPVAAVGDAVGGGRFCNRSSWRSPRRYSAQGI